MKPKIPKLLNVKRYWQGFNGTPALVYMATASGLKAMHETLGFGYTSFVDYFYNKTLYYGYSWDDLFSVRDNLLNAVKNDKNYLEKIGAKDKELIKNELSIIENVKKKSLKELSTKELIALYKELEQSYESSLGVSHVVEGFSLTCEDTIRNTLSKVAEQKKGKATLKAELLGEEIDPKKHELRVDVKAVTLHHFYLKKENSMYKASIILDI